LERNVTEEITDVDLVFSQLRIAAGESLGEPGLDQRNLVLRGVALQCRVTAAGPTNGFRPDAGRVTGYRTWGRSRYLARRGNQTGTVISARFDSMLVKLTCRGADFDTALRGARRALAEFRIRGVGTNIPFLQAVLPARPSPRSRR
jgi:pyruvate carboxylase